MTDQPQVPALLWTADEAAAALRITADQLENLHRLGKLPGVKVSARCLRWRPSDVVRYVESLGVEE